MKTETQALLVKPEDYNAASESAKKAAERGLCQIIFKDEALYRAWISAIAAHQELQN